MTYQVLQIHLSDIQQAAANAAMYIPDREESRERHAKGLPEFYRRYLNTKKPFTFDASDFYNAADLYEISATIEADSLEEVFEIGNIGPEDKITRHSQMHSVSVGDILVNDAAEMFVVVSAGFETLCPFVWEEKLDRLRAAAEVMERHGHPTFNNTRGV